jgi:type IV pilus assembly protein PilN
MRIALNLSSEPFRRDRPMVVASVATGVFLIGLLGMLVFLAVQKSGQATEARQEIAGLRKEVADLNREQARLEAQLQKPENIAVLDRVLFINTLLYRKGISWTKVFSDLEGVLPYNVRLVSIRPQVDSRNEIFLNMVVGSQTQPPVIEMLKRLENSPLFGFVEVHTWLPPGQNEPLFRYQVSVNYGRGR